MFALALIFNHIMVIHFFKNQGAENIFVRFYYTDDEMHSNSV